MLRFVCDDNSTEIIMNTKLKNIYKCAGCSLNVITPEKLGCANCGLEYHFDCVNTGAKKFIEVTKEQRTSWICPTCRIKHPRGDNTDTPVRGVATGSAEVSERSNVTIRRAKSSAPSISTQITLESVKCLIQEASDDLLARLEEKVTKIVDMKTREIFKEVS